MAFPIIVNGTLTTNAQEAVSQPIVMPNSAQKYLFSAFSVYPDSNFSANCYYQVSINGTQNPGASKLVAPVSYSFNLAPQKENYETFLKAGDFVTITVLSTNATNGSLTYAMEFLPINTGVKV